MPVDLSNLAVGTVVPGTKWVVCDQLGEDGMGRVLEVVKEPGIRRLLANLEHRNSDRGLAHP